ncbi:BlaI/MecI/CopY family transcriptional regulator [Anaerobaca lacustris]|uniref:BlaI/MecI/CopY family transcriptional regulator n=1 Tax=Anaerobaca lacustris TaxID=3044600 RepID=A0AAW6TY83_9BACT|nr:BlaI/MecI/CopY family transcriptional regulator [Sedimentisphaerales bacterium M17dextr]
MSRQAIDDLGQLQRAVMEILWSRGEATVHQVRDRLDREKELAYTTILTTLQKLERAGWLDHRAEGKSYVYFPTRSREQAGAGSVRRFLRQVFEGNAVAMFQHLIREGDLSDDDLIELRKMIEERRKERRK